MIASTLLALAALAQAAPGASNDPPIIVTGRSLSDTAADLAACLARRCPPREDIEASLAHAENQFVSGDYAAARHTLAKARGRNARHARDLPVEVADLTRAYGRLSNLDGYGEVGRILQIDALDALKAGLDGNDSRVLVQRLMVGDEFLRGLDLFAADNIYRKVEKQARAAKLPQVVGFAMLRQATIYGVLSVADAMYEQTARHRIVRLVSTTDPALAQYRDAAVLLQAQLAAGKGDTKALDAAIPALRERRFTRPVLLFAPPIEPDLDPNILTRPAISRGPQGPQWIDVSYLITPEGLVSDVTIVRQSDGVGGDWPPKVQQSLAGRRYAPMALDKDAPILQRVERFSYVHEVRSAIGSRIRQRSPYGRIASLDMTIEPPARVN